MITLEDEKTKLNISEQVSDKSMEIAEDAFFEHLKADRGERVSRFSQTMGEKAFARFTEALKLFDDEQDVMSKAFEQRLKRYFDILIELLETAMKKQSSGSRDSLLYSQAVEELYLINCERVRRENSYRIFRNHPMLLINKRLDAEVDEMLKEKEKAAKGSLARTEFEILQSVFTAKKKNRCRVKLYSRNSVYETRWGESIDGLDYICARPFEQSKDNTEIPVIRIWEKIKNYKELHGRDINTIHIAVFGNQKEQPLYNEVLEKLSEVRINWTFFRHEPMTGEYFFADNNGDLYDLLNMTDLQELTAKYEIISFLDQNCFYRQGQAEKDEKEKGADTICRWNFERSQAQKKFKDKAAYYQVIYNRVGQWLNAFDKAKSASFEFDERLYRNLIAVPKENSDIYLYLRYGDRIGRYDLSYNGICNDEYYNGIPLTVCRLTKFDMQQFNEDYRAFLEERGKSKESSENKLSAPIRFWKLIKSISNEYCDMILLKFGEEDAEQLKHLIKFMNESYLVLGYCINDRDEKIDIQYELQMPGTVGCQELQTVMKNTVSTILKFAFGSEELYCMNRYFERLLIHSVISNADDVGDLIFAYWIATHWYTTERLEEGQIPWWKAGNTEKDPAENLSNGQINRFKVRKTIFSAIKQLADMRIRDLPDMDEYFSASFHGRVCPEVSDENLKKTFQGIRDYCKNLQYTGSYLYLNSGILMGE